MTVGLLAAIFLPFAAALLLPFLRGRWEERAGWFALPVPILSLFLIWQAVGAHEGFTLQAVQIVRESWIPELGLSLSFRLDGLSVFFGSVVSGIGILIVAYALAYFGGHGHRMGRFFSYLCLFMGAMLGTVFSDNLLLLFIFWELTGIASFLLIGFQHDEKEASSRGARMALVTTGVGGLALLAGVVLLGRVYGTYELSEILALGMPPGSESLLTAAFLCCCLGIFTKSAQIPFNYWLPNAMAAPTPVSAYLHSATMVKLGVFLTARLLPVFSGLESWLPVLTIFGFGTMVLAAVLAVLSHDLKGVLAHSTVSQLGLLVGFYGLHSSGHGPFASVSWDYVHIANHVFYKAALFMIVGIIDHCAGTRDLRQLGGLFRRMPITGVAAALALASMAGLPFTSGFLSKELLLKACYEFASGYEGALAVWPIAAVIFASVLKVVFSVGIFHRAFLGREPSGIAHHWHAPSIAFQLPALLLALTTVYFGLAAGHFAAVTDYFAVSGMHGEGGYALSTWKLLTHLSPALLTSASIIAAGLLVYAGLSRVGWARFRVPSWLLWERGFDAFIDGLPVVGKKLVKAVGANRPSNFIPLVVVAFVTGIVGLMLQLEWSWLVATFEKLEFFPGNRSGWVRWLLVATAAVAVVALLSSSGVMAQILALSVIGIVVTLFFAFFHAPDLALTQILVESASLLLVILIVFRLRRGGARVEGGDGPRAWRAVAAIAAGLAFGACVLIFQPDTRAQHIGSYYLENTLPLAMGANAVNTILIDFRGFDTLLEITVLLIAALGCLGLLMRRRRDTSVPGLHRRGASSDLFPVPEDFILRNAGIALVVFLNLFALYLFFRGHNNPGGGFIAGLATALSLLLLGFILGIERTRQLVRVNGILLAAFGISLALLAGLLGPMQGLPFLYHFHGYTPELPLVGSLYIGTPMLFDLGVFLTVVGVVLKMVFPLMKSVHGLPAFVAEEESRYASDLDEPIDIRQDAPPPVRRPGGRARR